MREFLHVDDLGKAVLFALENSLNEHLYNVGTGTDLTIKELAILVQKCVGHFGEISWDETKPDGTPKKLLDSSKLISKGWNHSVNILEGVTETYKWFLENINEIKEVKI